MPKSFTLDQFYIECCVVRVRALGLTRERVRKRKTFDGPVGIEVNRGNKTTIGSLLSCDGYKIYSVKAGVRRISGVFHRTFCSMK